MSESQYCQQCGLLMVLFGSPDHHVLVYVCPFAHTILLKERGPAVKVTIPIESWYRAEIERFNTRHGKSTGERQTGRHE